MTGQAKIPALQAALTDRKISARELIEQTFEVIDENDKKLGAFLSLRREAAFTEAGALDEALARGEKLGRLAGLPIGLKDVICVRGERTTAASRILEPYLAAYNAAVVTRLKEAGAIIVGKTNLDEFACGASTEHSAFQETLNPYDSARVPGGSSGGSAAAVAAQMVPAALGSDTGGSIRQPAAFCGVVGFKPTYGRVSRFGLMAMASSLDQIGPLATSVEDAAIVLSVIAGEDPFDATSLPGHFNYAPADYAPPALLAKLKRLKIGLPREFFPSDLDKAVGEQITAAVKLLEKNGAQVTEVSLPAAKLALPIYYLIQPAEVSSNLARYDGMRYGLSQAGDTPFEVQVATRDAGFGEEVKRRILLGTFALSAGYYDAYYGRAKQAQAELKAEYEKVFEEVDVLCSPTTPTPAFRLGEKASDPVQMYLADIFTVTANLVGAPAVSVPCGRVDNLPLGLQIMGRFGDDERVLQTAAAYETIQK